MALTAAVAGAAALGPARPPGATAATERPNIVMILADDLDARTTPYWDAMPKTESLLAKRGMTFANTFAPMPICCAARGSILTGKYGHNTHVLTNSGDEGGYASFVAHGNEDKTFVKQLHDSGYRTGMAGKYLNGLEDDPTHIPPGWDDWNAGVTKSLYTGYDYTLNENGKMVEYGSDPDDYQVDVVADKSVDFITDASSSGQPFFWYAAATAPHLPMAAPPRYADNQFTDDEAPHLPNFQEDDVSDKPTWLRTSAAQRSLTVAATNDKDHQNRMGSLLALDDMVADILATLERTGELDNTYIVFTSDNGYNLGAHRLVQKMAPYEESMDVPMVITGPGVPHGTSDDLALSTDFAPTFLELAGLPIPSDVDGRSLAPQLRGEKVTDWRTDFLAEYGGPGPRGNDGVYQEYVPDPASDVFSEVFLVDLPSWSAVRDERYLYVRWYDIERDAADREYELYDLTKDPYQLDNLLATEAGRTKYAEQVSRLDARLQQLKACSGASCRS
ncbi:MULTISPECIES: sulfatase [unclassified Kribbella]|uniref:sulfatase family protein n=1 Tax=unclassified Kribbella TaxID=2644121 RepID=UPI0033C7C3CF